MSLFAAWFIASATLTRHADYQSNAFDLGYFDQLIWNTSQGRFFESAFIPFNFLGQHFEPALLVFALIYRLGAGVEALLITQVLMAALAAIPLYIAARRFGGSDIAGVLCSIAFLLSAPMHGAVNFDFHAETMAFFFVFSGAAWLAYGRSWLALASLVPLLLLKEDMALVVIPLALLIALRGLRREAATLAAIAGVWFIVTSMVLMPALRGNYDSDLTVRYSYLTDGTTMLNVAPIATSRAVQHLNDGPIEGMGRLLLSTGGLPLLNPIGFASAAGLATVSGLAQHQPQTELRLHYAVPVLALLWFASLLALDTLRRRQWRLPVAASAVMASCALLSFLVSSPFAPGHGYAKPTGDHVAAIRRALSMIPDDASVQAQSTLLPHLSQRRWLSEFPKDQRADYVILDNGLSKSIQSLAAGFDQRHKSLREDGYWLLYSSQGVELWRDAARR